MTRHIHESSTSLDIAQHIREAEHLGHIDGTAPDDRDPLGVRVGRSLLFLIAFACTLLAAAGLNLIAG